MKLYVIAITVLATACAQSLTNDYLPPAEEYSPASSQIVETNFLENEPAHSLADDGYRYKTVKRFRSRHRRDVNELSADYLAPFAASEPVSADSAPAASETYGVQASEPAAANSLSNDGYRYKTVKSYRLRHRY